MPLTGSENETLGTIKGLLSEPGVATSSESVPREARVLHVADGIAAVLEKRPKPVASPQLAGGDDGERLPGVAINTFFAV